MNHTYQRLFFTIEAIKKVERQDFFSSTKAKVVVKEKVQSDNSISVNYTVGPNEDDAIHFKERPILKRYFYEAIKLGFNIVRLPRVGGLMNPEVDTVRFKQDDHNLSIFLKKAFEVARKIEEKGAGMTLIKEIGKQYEESDWLKGFRGIGSKSDLPRDQ